MKKIFIPVILVFLSAATFAQVQRKAMPVRDSININETDATTTNEKMAKKPDRLHLMRELDLSQEQQVKVKEMNQKAKIKRGEVINNEQLSEAEKTEKLKEIKKGTAIDLYGILNEAQRAKMKALRKERKNGGN